VLDPATRARDFPDLEGQTYLNTAAEGIPPRQVHAAVAEYLADKALGMNGRDGHFRRAESCREVAARMVGLTPREVGFCSCASEAYNLLRLALSPGDTDEVVVSDLDFPAGVTPWLTAGCHTRLWQARDGALHVDDLERLLGPRTLLVQVSLVSFWNGHRIDWPAVHETVRRRAPDAVLAVDITQALGRIEPLCPGADIVISSTHKWALGIHGGCVVGIASDRAERLSPRAGGWYHVRNAFDADRFERADLATGAAAYAVGMPSFAALYALDAGLRYLEQVGVARIAAHADPLVATLDATLRELGLKPLAPLDPHRMSGIVAFRHADSQQLHALLEHERIHVMHHAGRIRLAVHGSTTADDVARFSDVLTSRCGAIHGLHS
jgi:cysteine desulfurase/selenocysteine lyase